MGRLIAIWTAFEKDYPKIRGFVNIPELVKACSAGAASGSIVAVLQALLAGVGTIFAAPAVPWITILLTLALMVIRALGQGSDPAKLGLKP